MMNYATQSLESPGMYGSGLDNQTQAAALIAVAETLVKASLFID